MTEQLRQRAQEIADEHCNDAYSVALWFLQDIASYKGIEIRVEPTEAEKINKIKSEAVREAINYADSADETGRDDSEWINGICEYANKLENQND